MELTIAGIVAMLLAAALFGFVIGFENGIEEERRNQEQRRK